MRNKLRRKNNAELREFESRECAPSAAGLHVGPAGSNEPAPRKGSARPRDDTDVGRECADDETGCKEHQHQGGLDGLLTRPVGHQSEGFQSFQGKRLSPERVLKQRCDASTPACTSVSVSSQQHCLEEIKKSNPAFPARRVFRFLQKKSSEKEGYLSSSGEKRKRQNEVNVPGKESKRQRQTVLAEVSSGRPPETGARSTEAVRGHSRLSRTQRLKHLRRAVGPRATPPTTQKTESETESTSHCPTTDAGIDDIPWTERYSPRHSSEVIGNTSSVNKVHSWLKKWRRRVDGCARREDMERKCPQNDDGLWDGGDFHGEAGSEGERVEQLSNTLLISGPPGVGKTASVYACAMELGFKVFEVNSSSRRSGRCVLVQLKEVTQSHLVEAPGKEALRPAYYNNYNNHHHHNSRKPDVLPGKSAPEPPASKQNPGPHRGHSRRRGPARGPGAATLARFFGRAVKEPAVVAGPPPETRREVRPLAARPAEPRGRDQQTAAMSLVLFEEVDVIFEEDVGFLSAIRTLMTMTKRPVVLTTSDPSFKERFDRDVEEIRFKTPSPVDVCSYLRLVCLAENAWTGQREVAGLLAECRGDIRRCLLQLHFLVKSGASRRPRRTGPQPPRQCVVGGAGRPKDGEENVKCVPRPSDTAGCLASVSCLNTLTKQNMLHLLKCQTWAESERELLTVLTESWRRRFPLLYSNLELLLPLPASPQGTPTCCPAKDPDAGMHAAQQPPPASQSPVQQQQQQQQQQGQPGEIVDLKSASTTAMRAAVRSGSRLSRRKGLLTVTALGSPATKVQPQSLESPRPAAQGSEDKSGDKGVGAQTHRALEALAHFADLMSYLDSAVAAVEPHVSGPCVSRDFAWTGAEVRDGLVDEMRGAEGERTWRQQEGLLEIRAAVEGLGFLVSRGRMSAGSRGAPTRCQRDARATERGEDRLSLPESAGRLSSAWPLLPQPSAARRRFELSRAVLQNRRISLLGSRRAVCLDYMPALRAICRHHHHHSVQLGLSKATMQLLAEEYME